MVDFPECGHRQQFRAGAVSGHLPVPGGIEQVADRILHGRGHAVRDADLRPVRLGHQSGAGVAGAGFSVVAEEIRKLSDESKATTEKIRKFTLLINQSVNKTVSKGEETSTIVGQQTKAIETVANDLYNLSEVAEQLYKLSHDQK